MQSSKKKFKLDFIPVLFIVLGFLGLRYGVASFLGAQTAYAISASPKNITDATSTSAVSLASPLVTALDVLTSAKVPAFFSQGVALKERVVDSPVLLDENATQTCGISAFQVDVSGKTNVWNTIVLNKTINSPLGKIEIGSLPRGIDVVFSKNNDYIYNLQSGESIVDLKITNEIGSQKGSFSVPFFYTETASSDSTVVCQMNILNL